MDKTDSAGLETEITLGVLDAVERNSSVTQRGIAGELGIALGLANAYLKRCVKKGWIKINEAPRNRYFYYLTPQGFSEKSRLTAEYLSQSFKFFRAARSQCSELLIACRDSGRRHIALAGAGDLAEIAVICAHIEQVPLEALLTDVADSGPEEFLSLPLMGWSEAPHFDAVLITELTRPHYVYEQLVAHLSSDRILVPNFLRIVAASSMPAVAGKGMSS